MILCDYERGELVKVRLTISIDGKLKEALKIDAVKKATTAGEIVEKLIASYLKTQNEAKK